METQRDDSPNLLFLQSAESEVGGAGGERKGECIEIAIQLFSFSSLSRLSPLLLTLVHPSNKAFHLVLFIPAECESEWCLAWIG